MKEGNGDDHEKDEYIIERSRFPKVSVILPARDEEKNIQRCLDSLVRQDYPNYEIIAVNDCSSDRTAEIMYEAMVSNPDKYVKIVDLQENKRPPPAGWVGKNWACFQGYLNSSGDILLFTDADTVHEPDTITLAVDHMINEKLDALTARPRIYSNCTWTKIILPLTWMVSHVIYSALRVNNSKSKVGFVFGGFYLIKRQAYDSLGTHESINDEIAEDLAIGEKLKKKSDERGMHGKIYFGNTDSRDKNYRLKMFLGNENIQSLWAPDLVSLHSAIRRAAITSFHKQRLLTCLYLSFQFFMLAFPWIIFPYSIFLFLVLDANSSTSNIKDPLLTSIFSPLLLALNLFLVGIIFASSFVISKLSLLQDLVYVLATPIACFFIFIGTFLSVIAAAAGNNTMSWKNREYEPAQMERKQEGYS